MRRSVIRLLVLLLTFHKNSIHCTPCSEPYMQQSKTTKTHFTNKTMLQYIFYGKKVAICLKTISYTKITRKLHGQAHAQPKVYYKHYNFYFQAIWYWPCHSDMCFPGMHVSHTHIPRDACFPTYISLMQQLATSHSDIRMFPRKILCFPL